MIKGNDKIQPLTMMRSTNKRRDLNAGLCVTQAHLKINILLFPESCLSLITSSILSSLFFSVF